MNDKAKVAKSYLKKIYGLEQKIIVQKHKLNRKWNDEEYKLKINKSITLLSEEREKIIDEIQELEDGIYVRFLYLRFVEYKNTSQLPLEMNCSVTQMYRTQREALKAFYDKYLGCEPDD